MQLKSVRVGLNPPSPSPLTTKRQIPPRRSEERRESGRHADALGRDFWRKSASLARLGEIEENESPNCAHLKGETNSIPFLCLASHTRMVRSPYVPPSSPHFLTCDTKEAITNSFSSGIPEAALTLADRPPPAMQNALSPVAPRTNLVYRFLH